MNIDQIAAEAAARYYDLDRADQDSLKEIIESAIDKFRSQQHKTTVREWTPKHVELLIYNAPYKAGAAYVAIADAHNAALRAQQEKPCVLT